MEVFFKRGIPGLENLRNFKINEIKNNEQFKLISSLEEEISFVVVSPFDFYSEYELDLNDETVKDLNIENPRDVLVLNILTLGDTLENSTINLKAPIIINVKNSLGKQYIMQYDTYDTKHPLIRREQNVSNY
ncbi:MAG: flagellar assembly protein FliW [Peptostreptococcaceae bacterium]